MERAVFVADLGRLPAPGEPCDRLYLGSEFCARRLPDERSLGLAFEKAAARGLAFSLVTPFLDEPGLAAALALARSLPQDAATEVVANDLGLILKLREGGWRGTVVAGRLLTRQRRGPGFQSFGDALPEAREALRGSALDSPAFVELLGTAFDVRRFELDDLVQGVAVPQLPVGVRLSLYRPWLLVTATRNCPWVFDGRTWDRSACARPCRGNTLRLTPVPNVGALTLRTPGGPPLRATPPTSPSTDGPLPGRRGGATGRSPSADRREHDGGPQRQDPAAGTGTIGRTLVLGGCAQFLEHRNDASPPPGVDRIVRQPEVPA